MQEAAAVDDGGQPNGVPGGYDKGDYLARVMNEPEFAAEQVREKDRKIDEANKKLSKYGPIAQYVEAVGAEGLQQFIDTGNAVLSNPQLAALVEEVRRTGQLPTAQPVGQETDDDPYEDPSVKELRMQLRELKASNERLQQEYSQRFAQAETRGLQTGIEKNIQTIMQQYGVNDSLREKLAQEINTRVQQGSKEAERGNKEALNMLSMLSGEMGVETLKRIIAPVILDEENLMSIASVRQTSKAKGLAAQSTGEPSSARTAGGGGLPPATRMTPNFVQQALEKATKEAGADPRNLW